MNVAEDVEFAGGQCRGGGQETVPFFFEGFVDVKEGENAWIEILMRWPTKGDENEEKHGVLSCLPGICGSHANQVLYGP